MGKCANDTNDFLTAMSKCLKNDPEFKIEEFMNSLQMNHKIYVQNLTLGYGATRFHLDYLDTDVWSTVFHRRFGLCYNLDLEKSQEYRVSQN